MQIPEANGHMHQQLKSPNARDRCRQRRADARKSHAEVTEEHIEAEEALNQEVAKKLLEIRKL